jgi:hypothetical protein
MELLGNLGIGAVLCVMLTCTVPTTRSTATKAAPHQLCNLGQIIEPFCASVSSSIHKDLICCIGLLSGFMSSHEESEHYWTRVNAKFVLTVATIVNHNSYRLGSVIRNWWVVLSSRQLKGGLIRK